jgi:methylated-DNA-[protein]-cysteine S-methyltransferase
MEIVNGSCRLGLWHVNVTWSGDAVHRVRFSTTGIRGPVPPLIRHYCAGRRVDLRSLASCAIHDDNTAYSRIYRAVREIPYGRTATYGEIARIAGTGPRVVGQAMARNITPLPATASWQRTGSAGSPRRSRSRRPCLPWRERACGRAPRSLRKLLHTGDPIFPAACGIGQADREGHDPGKGYSR